MYIPDEDWDHLINFIADLEKTFQSINERQMIVNTSMIQGLLNIIINTQDQPLPVSAPTDVVPKHKRIRGHYGKNRFVFRDIPKNIRKREIWVNGIADCVKKANEYGMSGIKFLDVKANKAKKKDNWSTHIDVRYSRD